MDANTGNITLTEIIQIEYQSYVDNLISMGSFALLVYTTILVIAEETEYMWSKRFSLPNLLYIFARYGNMIVQGLNFWILFLPEGSACNDVVNVANSLSIVVFVGIQGLLITRAYSICRGNKIVAAALGFAFSGTFALNIFSAIAFPGCIENPNLADEVLFVSLLGNIFLIVTDFLVFCVCLWSVWGTWQLKRGTFISRRNGLVSILLKQILSRFCFVSIFTITATILVQFTDVPLLNVLSSIQQTFSGLLLADFTLNLRRQNAAAIDASNMTLPTLHIQNVFQNIQQSILVELGDNENENENELASGSHNTGTESDHDDVINIDIDHSRTTDAGIARDHIVL